MERLVDLVLLALAVAHAIEVWRHGKIFADWRAWLEIEPLGEFVTSLMLCMFCLSLWVATILLLFYAVPYVGPFVVWSLAVTRLANLINDATHSVCRTPKQKGHE